MRVAYIILASGYSKRFNEIKLLYKINGLTLFEYTTNCVPFEDYKNTFVVTQYSQVQRICNNKNISVIINDMKSPGINYSIKVILEAIPKIYDGYMFFVSDQPFLSKLSCEKLVTEFSKDKTKIVALGYKNKPYNPVIFPSDLLDEFFLLPKNKGGKYIVNKHLSILKVINVTDRIELKDIDYKFDVEEF